MFDKDKWQEIFGTIRKNKLRTFLTALGVFWGIFMLVFLLGLGKGLENGVFKDFGSAAKNVMGVYAWRTSIPYNGLPAGRRVRLNLDDMKAIQQKIPEVDKVAPRLQEGGFTISYGQENNIYELRGEFEGMIDIEALILRSGRYINARDIAESRKVAVIGDKVKEVLFGTKNPIGKHILIKGIDFVVVGVYGPEQIKPWTRSDMESVVIPLPTMYRAFGYPENIDYFIASAKPGILVSEMETKIRALLRERHMISPNDPDALQGWNMEEEFQTIQNLFTGIKFFLWFVGIGTLLAGIVGVGNIMLIIVKERTKEIGIRKALGATPGSIISMILTESIFITSISGYLGLMFGTLIIAAANYAMESFGIEADNFHNPEVNVIVGIGAVIVLIIAGTIAGLLPAIQASRVNPVIALKDE